MGPEVCGDPGTIPSYPRGLSRASGSLPGETGPWCLSHRKGVSRTLADDEKKIGKAAGKGDHGGLSPPVSEACLALGGDQGTHFA